MTVNRLARPPKDLDSFIGRKWLESITNQQDVFTGIAQLDFLLVQQDPAGGSDLPNARNLEVTSELTITDDGGGGALTLDIADTAVTPGTYSSVTVTQKGRITGGTNPTVVGAIINTDGSLGVSGTTTVTVSIDTSHANIWTVDQSVPDEAYSATWDGSLEIPTKNALYDKIETIVSGGAATDTDLRRLIHMGY